jgi:Uma2 family endonuclease
MVKVGNIQIPARAVMAGFRRFSVDEYHRLTEVGVLTEDDNLELLEGYLVLKMARNPPHDGTIDLIREQIDRILPPGWMLRIQEAITLSTSEPEPDGAVVRGNARSFLTGHPSAAEIGTNIEVSDTTLDGDREDKGRIYASAGIPIYWIVNLVDRMIEVYTAPSGPTSNPGYAKRQDFNLGDDIPLILDGMVVAQIAVADLLP